jgi:putative endonuclease
MGTDSGRQYEEAAARWLLAAGLQLLERNFRVRGGEIDIIALDGRCLVFVEVRRRGHPRFSGAAASVDRRKRERLIRAAGMYLQRHPAYAHRPCRFDVIAYEPSESGAAGGPRWIRGAFTA